MKKGIIICVDDEKIVLNGLKAELKNAFGNHFIIETAENAEEALNTIDDLLASGYDIPVIISDYAMPNIKGDELLEKVHQRSPGTLKILLTGQATVEGVTNAINNARLYRYIEKPWETNDLILTVRQAIKSYQQENILVLQNQQLRELSNSLEEKIEERTKDLHELNKLLIEKQKEITRQNVELAKHRNHLESLVEERTRELSIAKEKAEESTRLKSAFMENISHEVRTPMNGILGFLDLMKDPDFEQKERRNYLNIIERCGKQLVDIITDIVEMSKLETFQVAPVNTICDIYSIRDNITGMFSDHFVANRNVRFKTSGFDENISLLTDEVKLKQIITNLMGNAIKNTERGSIELGFRMEKNKDFIFFVKDTGIGIPKEFHDVIFDRFRQVDVTLTRIHSGTGLGLAISKAYVELLGGKIWLESEPDEGSTFFFSIPRTADNQLNVVNHQTSDENVVSLAGMTILIAEDVDINFNILEIILKRKKVNIIRAFNGEEAVNICCNNDHIDMVLMDLKMPVLNGLDATRKILEFRNDLPIIAQTAYASYNDRLNAIENGCVDYISKPIKSNLLLELISKHVIKKTFSVS